MLFHFVLHALHFHSTCYTICRAVAGIIQYFSYATGSITYIAAYRFQKQPCPKATAWVLSQDLGPQGLWPLKGNPAASIRVIDLQVRACLSHDCQSRYVPGTSSKLVAVVALEKILSTGRSTGFFDGGCQPRSAGRMCYICVMYPRHRCEPPWFQNVDGNTGLTGC